MSNKTVVVLSGGLDSTVLLYHLLKEGHQVRAISVDYGQRHKLELDHARQTALSLKVPFQVADLSGLREILPGSSQTSDDVPVPHGHYAAENMKTTVVPNRNMILLAVAIGHAIAHDCQTVAYAAHAGDHTIYPDCREEFVRAMVGAAALCDWKPVDILRPFIWISKTEIVRLGWRLGVDFRLTYSCYQGQEEHCGKCGTCVERIEAFREAGVMDPTRYQTRGLSPSLTT